MIETQEHSTAPSDVHDTEDVYVVLCASGFENPDRVRSALMFATLAASANYKAILYCIQNAVDVMVKGNVDKGEVICQGNPTIAQRLQEAIELGVEIQCCTQTMANRHIAANDLLPRVRPAGAMSLIDLTTRAKGTISF